MVAAGLVMGLIIYADLAFYRRCARVSASLAVSYLGVGVCVIGYKPGRTRVSHRTF